MGKLFVLAFFIVVAGVLAEPPSNYLPPQARNTPSSQYGAPGAEFGRIVQDRGTTSIQSQQFGSQSFSYNSEHKASEIGVSQLQNAGHGSFGASRSSFGSSRSSVGNNGRFNGLGIAQQYGAPAQRFSAPNQSYFALSPVYGFPSQRQTSDGEFSSASGNGFAVSSKGRSSAKQGFSEVAGHRFGASSGGYAKFDQRLSSANQGLGVIQAFSIPSSQYGVPLSQYAAPFATRMDDDLSEPANYEYNYQVLAADESGAEFGHQETRQNEAVKGQYHVLLPDGRIQIVEYVADEEGFRPNVHYEKAGRYPAPRNSGFGGPY